MNFTFFLEIAVCAFVITSTYANDKESETHEKLPPPECVTDADCKWQLRCINGRCEFKKEKEQKTLEKLPPPECVTDADCPWVLRCINGKCEMKKEK